MGPIRADCLTPGPPLHRMESDGEGGRRRLLGYPQCVVGTSDGLRRGPLKTTGPTSLVPAAPGWPTTRPTPFVPAMPTWQKETLAFLQPVKAASTRGNDVN